MKYTLILFFIFIISFTSSSYPMQENPSAYQELVETEEIKTSTNYCREICLEIQDIKRCCTEFISQACCCCFQLACSREVLLAARLLLFCISLPICVITAPVAFGKMFKLVERNNKYITLLVDINFYTWLSSLITTGATFISFAYDIEHPRRRR